MKPSSQLDIQAFLDSRPFGPFQCKILLLCLTVLVLDGFDVVAMGFIAPALVADWNIPREELGVVMSMGLFGLAIGALMGGPLADRFGRRKVIIVAIKKKGGRMIFNPSAEMPLEAGDTLVAIGHREHLDQLEGLANR